MGLEIEVDWVEGAGGRGRGVLLCWSAAEQTFSIRVYSEVTNWESPHIHAKLDSAQPVAAMPASVADDWGWG